MLLDLGSSCSNLSVMIILFSSDISFSQRFSTAHVVESEWNVAVVLSDVHLDMDCISLCMSSVIALLWLESIQNTKLIKYLF